MKNEKRFPVALAKETCPVCLKEYDGPILLSERIMDEKGAKAFEDKLHHKSIGFMDHPCDECMKAFTDAGVEGVFIIGIDENKSTPESQFRTGNIWGVKATVLDELEKRTSGDDSKRAILFGKKNHFMFMDYRVAAMIGLPDVNYKPSKDE